MSFMTIFIGSFVTAVMVGVGVHQLSDNPAAAFCLSGATCSALIMICDSIRAQKSTRE